MRARTRDPPAEQKLNSSRSQLAECVRPKFRAELGEDAIARVHENEARIVRADAGVEAPDAAHQIEQLGDRLSSGKPSARDDEAEQLPPLLGVRLDVGKLQEVQHAIA